MSSNSNGIYTPEQKNEYNKIRSLYVGLEKLSIFKDDEQYNAHTIEQNFQDFFRDKREYPCLFEDTLLKGSISEKYLKEDSLTPEDVTIEINGETLLLRAMAISGETQNIRNTLRNIIEILIEACPKMIFFQKPITNCRGITPLHIAILKEDIKLLEIMSIAAKKTNIKLEELNIVSADGSAFKNTIMMAGTPLGVATLKFNRKIFQIVLEMFGFELEITNRNEDNIIHSLVKYAHQQPGKKSDVLKMLQYLLSDKFIPQNLTVDEKAWKEKILKLLMMKNKGGLNALQLAVKWEQYEVFELIMNNEVYCSRGSSDGLFNEDVFDITEIETLAIKEDDKAVDEHESRKKDHHNSILEFLIYLHTTSAFIFADFMPVREVIKAKWNHYILMFRIWFILHFLFMSLLSVAALYRSKLEELKDNNVTRYTYKYPVTVDAFVTIVSVTGTIVGLFYIFLEFFRCRLNRFQLKKYQSRIKNITKTPYSNAIFRVFFGFFSLFLISDFILSAIVGQNVNLDYQNYCLLFAVILGWYLLLFFLQTIKTFGFFTVLLQRVIWDMLKFAVVMGIFLVAFSVAMYMAMQGANTDGDDFENFGKTMVKMLTIMLGIGELDILFQARQPIVSVMVFVLFVLLTTILLLNALIATMSNSCTDLMSNFRGNTAAKMHSRLQKLSVILFLESVLPLCMLKEVGFMKEKRRYENNKWEPRTKRRLWTLSSVHEKREDDESFDATDNMLTTFNWHKGKKQRKKSHKRNNKAYPVTELSATISTLNTNPLRRTLQIRDIEGKQCHNCKTESMIHNETQEIVETIDVPVL